MDFDTAVTEVLAITKRPDKEVETKAAINASISYFVKKGTFPADLVELTKAIDGTLYGDTISLATDWEITDFRKFKYIKPTGVRKYLRGIGSDQIFSPTNSMQTDCYYTAGGNLTYVLSSLVDTLEIGYYRYPAALVSGDSHWLLTIEPYAVVYAAAAKIHRNMENPSVAASLQKEADDLFRNLLGDCGESLVDPIVVAP